MFLGKICFKVVSGISVNVSLTNGTINFQKTANIKICLSGPSHTYLAMLPPKKGNTKTIKNVIKRGPFMNLIKSEKGNV